MAGATSTKRVEKLTYKVKVRNFELTADVPADLGGNDQGPTPHEFLEIALSACTAITMQMYADRKKIPLESSDVRIRIAKEGASNLIMREIQLIGSQLTEENKAALLAIAEKCPVHKFLRQGTSIESKLVESFT